MDNALWLVALIVVVAIALGLWFGRDRDED